MDINTPENLSIFARLSTEVKIMFLKLKLLITGLVLLGELIFVSNHSSAKTPISYERYQVRSKIEVGDPPPTDPPGNDSRPGGTLDPSDPCYSVGEELTALVPPNNISSQNYPNLAKYPLLTVSEHPTFLFYVPYEDKQVRYGEFSIHAWPDEESLYPYSIEFMLPKIPGIASLSVDSSSGFSLEDGKDYRWRLKLYCGSGNTASDYVIVRGLIRKVPNSSETEALVDDFAPEIWYDSIATLAERLQLSTLSNESIAMQQWFELLGLVDLGEADPIDLTPDLIQGSVSIK